MLYNYSASNVPLPIGLLLKIIELLYKLSFTTYLRENNFTIGYLTEEHNLMLYYRRFCVYPVKLLGLWKL